MLYVIKGFAQVYGGCAYGASGYQNSSCDKSVTTTSTTPSGNLSNTGFDILLIATIACALIFAAMVVRIWRKPRKQTEG